jgi:hypothetical protein
MLTNFQGIAEILSFNPQFLNNLSMFLASCSTAMNPSSPPGDISAADVQATLVGVKHVRGATSFDYEIGRQF